MSAGTGPTADSEHVSVVIVGGGPTGITAATLLAQYGVDTMVLERWSQVYPQPRAVHLDDEVYRILARLGVADEFGVISRPARGLRLVTRDLTVLAEFNRDSAVTPNGFPAANMFDQPALEELLRRNLKRYPCARLRPDTEVLGITTAVSERPRLQVRDRTSGHESVVTADYVLGCDGANSVVRDAIGSTMRDLKFDQRWLVVDVETTVDLRQWDGVHQVCDEQRAATYMRIGDARYRWEFALLDNESADDFASLAALRPLIAPWTRHVGDAELTIMRVAEYTFRAQIADRWRSGPIFLLGDAAHLTPPFIGQGMGAGLRDAMNLAWKIAGVCRGELSADILDSYQQERKPHAGQMIALALRIGRAMTAGGRFGSAVRRLVLPKLRLVPGVRTRITNSETPALRRSRMVKPTVTTRGVVGRLCPNDRLHNGCRIDQELGSGFGVVTAAPLTPQQQRTVDERGAHTVTVSPGSALFDWLRDRHVTAVVVRPDRTVMCAGRDLTALCRALPTFRVDHAPAVRAGSGPGDVPTE